MGRWAVAVALVCLSATPARAQAPAATKLAVMPTQFDPSARGRVPELFDDYVLTAVEKHARRYQVFGHDDLAALLGFEKQKELLSCGDTSCMAALGSLMGAEVLVVLQVAAIGNEWVVTAKVINIKTTKVESRVSHMTPGDVRKLLEDVDVVVGKLFAYDPTAGQPPPAAPPPPPPQEVASAPSPPEQVATESAPPAPQETATAAEPVPPEPAPAETPAENPAEPPPPAATVAVAPQPPATTTVEAKGGGGLPIVVPILVSIAGAGGLGLGAAFGVMAADSERCANDTFTQGGGGCPGGQRAATAVHDQALIANVSFVAGGVVAAAGIVLFFFTGGDDDPVVAPVVGSDAAGLTLSGRF